MNTIRRFLRSPIVVKKTSIKRLFFVLCLICLLFPVGCARARQRRLDRYREAQTERQQAARAATVERFMEKYPDNWQQKLHEYDVRLKEEAGPTGGHSQPTTTVQKVSASKTPEEAPVENLGRFSSKIEKCNVCGKTIPKLEQHFIINEKIVCKECFAKLKAEK